MARKLETDRLVIATHNKGKVREISGLLQGFKGSLVTSGELGLPVPDETETTFLGNSRLKALAAAKASRLPALADDSGMAVTALGGAPGVYSADWAGPQKDFVMAMNRVNDALGLDQHRSASFICVLTLAWPDGHTESFEGRIDGNLCWPPRGDKGFGYDPMFVPLGHNSTFGEITTEEKQGMSHRAQAFSKLVAACLE